jgi:hypothetical protein
MNKGEEPKGISDNQNKGNGLRMIKKMIHPKSIKWRLDVDSETGTKELIIPLTEVVDLGESNG